MAICLNVRAKIIIFINQHNLNTYLYNITIIYT